MGGGVAKAIRDKWPQVYSQYIFRPKGKVMLGVCDIVYINSELSVANLYGQLHLGSDGAKDASELAIEQSLNEMFYTASRLNVTNIYLPKIGSLRGGLDWDTEVAPIIERVNILYPTLNVTICTYEEKPWTTIQSQTDKIKYI